MKKEMALTIRLENRHLLLVTLVLGFFIGLGTASAFGGSSPAVLGHSAGELIVDATSVVDNSLTGSDIDESTLGTVPSASSASTAGYASESAACGNGGSGDGSCEMRTFHANAPGSAIVAQIGSSLVAGTVLRLTSPVSPTLQFETTSGGSTLRAVTYSNPGDLLDLGSNVRFTALSNPSGSFAISVNDLTLDDNTAAANRVPCWLDSAGSIGRCTTAVDGTGSCTCGNS